MSHFEDHCINIGTYYIYILLGTGSTFFFMTVCCVRTRPIDIYMFTTTEMD